MTATLNKTKTKGVLLLQMGGPNSLEDVEGFLFNLFKDKYIIQLPWFMQPFQKIFARIISQSRSKKVVKLYEEIGGKSPIKFETESQAKALEKKLNKESANYKVYYAMRYSYPFLSDAIQEMDESELEELTVIPLYPQYSVATSGSSIFECKESFAENGFAKKVPIKYVESWHDNEYFIRLIHDRIKDKIREFEEEGVKDPKKIHILFSAHGLPEKYVLDGDPYQEQVIDSVKKIMGRLPEYFHSISYQSRVGPIKWLQPSTEDELKRLAKLEKVKNLIVVPISFVGDHIETLHEIGIEYCEYASGLGIENFKITRLPKANKLLVQALESLIT